MDIYEPKEETLCPPYTHRECRSNNLDIYHKDNIWSCDNVMTCKKHDWIKCPSVKFEYDYLCKVIVEHMFDISNLPDWYISNRCNLILDLELFKTKLEKLKDKIELAGGLPNDI